MIAFIQALAVFVMSEHSKRSRNIQTAFAIAVFASSGLFTAQGLKIDYNNRRLIVEPEDMTGLMRATYTSTDRGGWTFCQMFKKAAARGYTYRDLRSKDCSFHHIFPDKEIKVLVKKNATAAVEEYINEKFIKTVFFENDIAEAYPKEEHGNAIRASISCNPHNLVKGPNAQNRCNDPSGAIDMELLECQRKEYQEAVMTLKSQPTLQMFGKLPPSIPVQFIPTFKEGRICYEVPKYDELQANGNSLNPRRPMFKKPSMRWTIL